MTDADAAQQARGAVAVKRAIVACSRCALRPEATDPVPWHGPLSPTLAVLGEAPGRTENKTGQPFSGPAGNLLRGVLKKNGYNPDVVTYLNAACCFPSVTRTPTEVHLAACRIHLAGQLAAIQPVYLLVVGTIALSAVVGKYVSMKEVRGRPLWLERLQPFLPLPRPVICWPTYHPAAALRSSAYRMKIEEDVTAFSRWSTTSDIFPGSCVRCGEEVEHWDDFGLAWCQRHAAKQLELL